VISSYKALGERCLLHKGEVIPLNGSFAKLNQESVQLLVTSIKSKGLLQQAEVAQGVLGRLRPPIILTFQHYKGGRSSAVCIGHLYPRRNPWYSLSEARSTSGYTVLFGEPRKKSPVTTGNRSRDRPT